MYYKSFKINSKTRGVLSAVVKKDGINVSITSHERDISNTVNNIKNPNQLLYISKSVGDLIERRTVNRESATVINSPLNLYYDKNKIKSIPELIKSGKLTISDENKIKNPDQLLYVATKVRDLIAQHTQKEQSVDNRKSAISSVHKSNPLRQTNNVMTISKYTNKQEKSIENNKKSTIQGEMTMTIEEKREIQKILIEHEKWLQGEGGQRADFSNGDYQGLDFGEILEKVNLENANLSYANFEGVNFSGANLTGANLVGAALENANLSSTNLENADLQEANLTGADLIFSNLRKANLQEADLTGANLYEANLQNALLVDANLEKTVFKNANLEGANYAGTKLEKNDMAKNTFKQEKPWYSHNGQEGFLYEDSDGKLDFYTFGDHNASPFSEFEILEEETGKKTYDDLNLGTENYGKSIIFADVRDFEDKRKLVDRFVTEDFYKEDLYERELCVETTEEFDWKSDLTSFKEFIVNKIQSGLEINKEELGKEWQKINDKYSLPSYSPLEGSAPSIDSILKGVALLTEIKTNEEEVTNAFGQLEAKIDINTLKKTDDWRIVESKPYINAPTTYQVYKLHYQERPDSEFNRVVIGELSSKDNALQFVKQVEKYTHERETSNDLKTLKKLTNVLEKNETMSVMHPELGEILVEAGETGKSGYGLKHIIERRHNADKKNIDEISVIAKLVVDTAEKGVKTRENNRFLELEKDGIIALIRHKNTDKNSPWVLSGFASWDKEKEATVAIKTVIAKNGYTPEYSSFRNQVGAVIASLDKEYTNKQEMSSKKDLELEAKKIEITGEKKMSDMNQKSAVDAIQEPGKENTAFVPTENYLAKQRVLGFLSSIEKGNDAFSQGKEKENGSIVVKTKPTARLIADKNTAQYFNGANQVFFYQDMVKNNRSENTYITYDAAQEFGGIKLSDQAKDGRKVHPVTIGLYEKNGEETKISYGKFFSTEDVVNRDKLLESDAMKMALATRDKHNTFARSEKNVLEVNDASLEGLLEAYSTASTLGKSIVITPEQQKQFQESATAMKEKVSENGVKPFFDTMKEVSYKSRDNVTEFFAKQPPKQERNVEQSSSMER